MRKLLVKAELNGKVFEKQVNVEVDKVTGMVTGKVGSYPFYWRVERYELPMLRLSTDQYKELYKKCTTAKEKADKLRAMRAHVKTFLLAYKVELMKLKATELYGTIPVHEDAMPDGFESVSDSIFEVGA